MSQPQSQPRPAGTSGLAITALVLAFLFPIIGLILGYVARSQIKKTGEQGDGLAIAAIVIGWVFTALVVILIAIPVLLNNR